MVHGPRVEKTTPILEPMAQLNIGANFKLSRRRTGKAHGHVSARDPITGAKKWEVKFKQPPLASLLSTGGNLLFVPDARGSCAPTTRTTGKELWRTTTAWATTAASSATWPRASSTSP